MDIRLVDGLANLLSVQIQLAEADNQKKLREKAELKALRAQIQPPLPLQHPRRDHVLLPHQA
jgi:two-component system LytT family sensor kinase/two-component system sensor histidine kinase LytS